MGDERKYKTKTNIHRDLVYDFKMPCPVHTMNKYEVKKNRKKYIIISKVLKSDIYNNMPGGFFLDNNKF